MANHYVGDGLPTIRDVRVLPRANRAFLTGHSRSRAATSSTPNLWLVCASKVYSGLGADIVYGIITRAPWKGAGRLRVKVPPGNWVRSTRKQSE